MANFKKLTVETWRHPDPISQLFSRLSQDPSATDGGDQWAELLLEPHLSEHVPIEVRKLFEVARGAMLYGYFFYPLYTLGNEQVFRVLESALRHKCRTLEAPSEFRSFANMKEWLESRGHLAESEIWEAARYLRNEASHPECQDILTPHNAIRGLNMAVRLIDPLFSATPEQTQTK